MECIIQHYTVGLYSTLDDLKCIAVDVAIRESAEFEKYSHGSGDERAI